MERDEKRKGQGRSSSLVQTQTSTTNIIGSNATAPLENANAVMTSAGTPQQSVNVVSPTVNNTNNVDQSQNNSYSKTSNYNNLKDMYSPEVAAARKFAVM